MPAVELAQAVQRRRPDSLHHCVGVLQNEPFGFQQTGRAAPGRLERPDGVLARYAAESVAEDCRREIQPSGREHRRRAEVEQHQIRFEFDHQIAPLTCKVLQHAGVSETYIVQDIDHGESWVDPTWKTLLHERRRENRDVKPGKYVFCFLRPA